MSSLNDLASLINSYQLAINDNSDIYVGDALYTEKGRGKVKKGRENLAYGDPADPIVVIDSTLFGSVSEGFFITEEKIYAKASFEDKVSFNIDEISTIYVDEKENALVIDNTTVGYTSSSLNPRVKIVVDCIKDYLSNRIVDLREKDAIQQGQGRFLKKIQNQLFMLQNDLTRWNHKHLSSIYDLISKVTLSSPMGMESFFEKAAIRVTRSSIQDDYKKLREATINKIKSVSGSLVIIDANKTLENFKEEYAEFGEHEDIDLEPVFLSHDVGSNPDSDTSTSNEDWDSSMEDALKRLDCAEVLINQLNELIKKIEVLIDLESDDE